MSKSVGMAPLAPEHVGEVSRMASEAFAHSPVYSYVLRAAPLIGQPADPVDVLEVRACISSIWHFLLNGCIALPPLQLLSCCCL